MFPISRRFTKLIAIFLATLMLVGNPAIIVPASAAADSASSTQTTELPVLTLEKPTVNETPATQAAFNSDSSRLSTDQKAEQFLNQLIPYYLQNGKRQGPQWLRTTDINFSFTENYKPVFSLETIQPFSQTTKNSELLFWQGRYSHQSDADSTANLGIGWRKLSEDKTSLLGFNAFYDYGFKQDLSRVGIGAEYFNKLAEYRANFYFPTSGDRQIGETISNDGILYTYIRAVQGLDYEVGSTLANAQWLGFYASGFYYDNKHNDDEKGYKLRSTLQLSPRLSMEMGYTKSNLSSGDLYGKIQYQLADKLGPSLFGDNHKDKKSNDISYKLLQKVQRENQIKTETFTKFVSYIGSIGTTVTNGSGQPIQGARLQAYQNGNPVGSAVITNAAGIGVISGLNVGTYTIRATYFNYSNDSSAVTVQKDQMANTGISLPVVGGNLVVNVFDAQGGSVSGATVTANVVSESSEHARSEGNLFDRILGVKTAFAAEAVFTLSMTTGSDGTALFTNLPPGNYRFTVQANGQSMNSIPATVPTNGGTSNVNVVLPSSNNTIGSAAITVTDGSSPMSGAAVSVTVNGTTQTVTTNSAGLATFSDMPAGSYIFSVSKEGYISSTVTVAVNNGVTAAGKIALARQVGTITITITDGTSTVSGATVTLNETTSETTDEAGQVVFASQPVGVTSYTVTAFGYDTKNGSITIVNGTSSSETIAITRQIGNATITVTNGTDPISDATVSISGLGDWTVTTNELGQTTFNNVPTGTYIFTVTKTGYSSSYTIVEVDHGTTASGTITTVRQSGTALITVREGSTPIQGAAVSVTVDGTEHTITTDSVGRAQFAGLPTGSYTFTVTKTGYNTTTCSTTVIPSGLVTAAVSLTRQTGSATITVDDGTNSLSGATVSISGLPAWTTTTNELGKVTFTSLPTGSYTVTLSKEGYNTATTTLTIANGQETIEKVHLVKKLGDVLVAVRDASTNTPLPTVTATLTGNGVNATGTTDIYGVVIIPDLPDGTYSLTVTKADYSSMTTPVTVSNGERSYSSIKMSPVPVTGTITAIVYYYDTDYHELPGLSVSTTINGTNVTAVTNSTGRAIFTNVPYGLYSITVSDGTLQYPSQQVMVSSPQPNPIMAFIIDHYD
ncbi:Carboxypeptidase regulatory-like domain-containing protein [Pelosinus propionicus DSM 13327]|uniref:Carboxypeptidase regulatory-like domain-containing protein n=1 Tax=Pelosinus propionicus DSM 13327 TaxID=1123291 RepID=A0A1I4K7B4_9FIRM|nr:Carboxypeptidase regulatory-like domain-containing protein [Pelosinus propionicus DSM 13327]